MNDKTMAIRKKLESARMFPHDKKWIWITKMGSAEEIITLYPQHHKSPLNSKEKQ